MSPMPDDSASREVSRILQSDDVDFGKLLPLVYEQLRQIAQHQMVGERGGHTLQPTALVNEAFVKLVGRDNGDLVSKGHFFAAAAEAMRRILVDHARGKGRQKRGRQWLQLPLDVIDLAQRDDLEEIVAVDEAVQLLEERDPRLAEVAKLRFYAGLSDQEIAATLGVTDRTVRRDWVLARAFLQRALG